MFVLTPKRINIFTFWLVSNYPSARRLAYVEIGHKGVSFHWVGNSWTSTPFQLPEACQLETWAQIQLARGLASNKSIVHPSPVASWMLPFVAANICLGLLDFLPLEACLDTRSLPFSK